MMKTATNADLKHYSFPIKEIAPREVQELCSVKNTSPNNVKTGECRYI